MLHGWRFMQLARVFGKESTARCYVRSRWYQSYGGSQKNWTSPSDLNNNTNNNKQTHRWVLPITTMAPSKTNQTPNGTDGKRSNRGSSSKRSNDGSEGGSSKRMAVSTVGDSRRHGSSQSVAVSTGGTGVRTDGTSPTGRSVHTGSQGSSVRASSFQTPTASSRRSNPTTSLNTRHSVPSTVENRHGGGLDDSPSVNTTLSTSVNTSAMFQPSERDLKKENSDRRLALQEYIRNELFPRWKFFTHRKQTVYSGKKGGIVLKICNDMHVRPEHREKWWDTHSQEVVGALNRKRADVTNYLKKVFIGENRQLMNEHQMLIILSSYHCCFVGHCGVTHGKR